MAPPMLLNFDKRQVTPFVGNLIVLKTEVSTFSTNELSIDGATIADRYRLFHKLREEIN